MPPPVAAPARLGRVGILLGLILEQPLRDLQPLAAAAQRMRGRIRSHGLTPISAAEVAAASGLRPSRAWPASLIAHLRPRLPPGAWTHAWQQI